MTKEELKIRTESFAVRVSNFIIPLDRYKAVELVSIFSAAIRTIKSGNPDPLILNPK